MTGSFVLYTASILAIMRDRAQHGRYRCNQASHAVVNGDPAQILGRG
jgi:hypothetical protein